MKVTNSYLGLDKDKRKCQNEEPFYNCTTKKHIDTVLKQCRCLPFQMRRSYKVIELIHIYIIYSNWFIIILLQEPLCYAVKELECVNLAKVNVDTSSCLKPCSGLIITSFAKSDKNLDLDSRLPLMDEYNNYKKITQYPSGYNGKFKIDNN